MPAKKHPSDVKSRHISVWLTEPGHEKLTRAIHEAYVDGSLSEKAERLIRLGLKARASKVPCLYGLDY